jgi:hypothetical protein
MRTEPEHDGLTRGCRTHTLADYRLTITPPWPKRPTLPECASRRPRRGGPSACTFSLERPLAIDAWPAYGGSGAELGQAEPAERAAGLADPGQAVTSHADRAGERAGAGFGRDGIGKSGPGQTERFGDPRHRQPQLLRAEIMEPRLAPPCRSCEQRNRVERRTRREVTILRSSMRWNPPRPPRFSLFFRQPARFAVIAYPSSFSGTSFQTME